MLQDELATVEPEVSQTSPASVSGYTGTALGLFDGWLTGRDTQVPDGLAVRAPRIAPQRWP
ncbi:hypothetical protein [Streptomyces flaveolus]|uniref:hypothetical protein n=1 Tax=Streptomyces flaveolus TaxID=67297 RepID=UPI0033D01AE5